MSASATPHNTILHPRRYGNLCYYVTAQRLGLDFRFVMQPSTKGGPYPIDVEEIAKHIDDVRGSRSGKPALTFS